MIAQYEAPTKLTYFFVTPTLANYTSFTPLMKNVVAQIEAPKNVPKAASGWQAPTSLPPISSPIRA